MKELKFVLFQILMAITFLGCLIYFFTCLINGLGVYNILSSLAGALTSILLLFIIKDLEQRTFNLEDSHNNEDNMDNYQDSANNEAMKGE